MIHLETIERMLRILLRGLLGLAGAIAILGTAGLAAGTDEAWILSSLKGISDGGDPELAIPPTLTSGGLFAAIHGSLLALGMKSLWGHRLVTIGCVVVAVAAAWRLLPDSRTGSADPRGRRDERLLLLAGIAAAPGALTLAGLGHAEWMATTLMLAAVVIWQHTEGRAAARWVGCGIVIGLAMATRSPAIGLAPGLLGWALLSGPGWRARLRDAVGVLAVGAVVLAGCLGVFAALAPENARPAAAASLEVMGLRGLLPDYPLLLNRLIVGERILPLAWLAAITGAALYWGCAGPRAKQAPLPAWTMLLGFAWSIWLLWMLRAPIAHLRYLWPGLGALGVATGITLALMVRHARGAAPARATAVRAVCLGLGVAILAGPVGSGLRHLANGQTDLVMWEWSGQTALSYTRRFQHVRDQRDAAAWLREHVDATARVAVFSQPFALRYLSERHIRAFWNYLDSSRTGWRAERPGWLVLQPHNHAFRYLSPEAHAWIEANCALREEFGSYAIYQVRGAWPDDLSPFRLHKRPVDRFPGASYRFGTSGMSERQRDPDESG